MSSVDWFYLIFVKSPAVLRFQFKKPDLQTVKPIVMKSILKVAASFLIAPVIFISCRKDSAPIANSAPIAYAGNQIVIRLPLNTILLNGKGTDGDGYIVSYMWSKISGPSSFLIVNPNNASTEVRNLVDGDYNFQLKVTDNDMLFATAVVSVVVIDSANVSCVGCWD